MMENKTIRDNRLTEYLNVEIKCPLCESKRNEVIYEVTSKEIANQIDNRNKRVKQEIEEIWKGTSCKFMKCKDCSFSFANPFEQGTEDLYKMIYTNNYPTDKWEYRLAEEEVKEKDICLEIGGGEGLFSDKIKSKCKEVKLVEISNDEGDYKTLDEVENEKRYTKVFMFQVLEHLKNFKETMSKIDGITTEDARVIISVPDEESVEFFRKNIGITDGPPIHVSRWNWKTIKELRGWKIERYDWNYLSKGKIIMNLFYGTRTKKYPRTKNPILLIRCLIEAIKKRSKKRLKESQYFVLIKR